MIPRDIESGEQWQVRYETPGGSEIVRTGTEAQMRFLTESRAAFGPILEVRTITVGAWRDPDAPEQKFEEGDEADG